MGPAVPQSSIRHTELCLIVKAAPGAVDVNLATVEAIQAILASADAPVSRYYILKRLKAQGRSTVQARLDRVLGYFFRHKLAYEGSKGIQWTYNPDERLHRAIAKGRRL